MAEYAEYDSPVNFITGALTNFGEFMADVHPILTEDDAEAYVDRVNAFAWQVGQMIDALEASADRGIVPTDRSIEIALFQIGVAIGNGDAEQHPLVTDIATRVEAIPDTSRAWAGGIVANARAAVGGPVTRSLVRLAQTVQGLDGRSDREPGVWALPGGADYYGAVLRHHLTIDVSPDEVHDRGLAEVERVTTELALALDDLGYTASDDFAGAMLRAAADGGALPTRSEAERAAVLDANSGLVEEAETVFRHMFSVRPDTPLDVVRPRPGREGTGAYYRPPPVDGSRGGVYYLSLGGTEFGLLTMATTTYHEAVPGHHFQLSVQRSLDELPLHQRVFDFTGYAEGWALYAERLAHEAGLYDDDPYGNVGRLRMELLRAARMVADTGIHHHRWSRDEAIDYMKSLGFEAGQATGEVDRYIVWPGQAPAYMVGMLEILRLREEARATLGDAFVLIGFHDALLGQGSVPVALLEDVVELWMASEQ